MSNRTRRPEWLGPDAGGRAMPRRDFLRGLAAVTAGAALPGSLFGLRAGVAGTSPAAIFPDGVKAGDPRTHGAVLWSRVLPPLDGADVPVLWTVAEDPALQQVVRGGVTWARGDAGHMVKLEVGGLAPDRWYHYRFDAPGGVSPVVRLRTAPARSSQPDRLRYAFASCQQRTRSVYVAHRAMSEESLDFFMHLGDYIYVNDHADVTLDDYRRRWRIFHENPLLQQLQATVPIVAMWDDGEFYNGVDRTGDPARLAAGRRAFFEHMPVYGGRQDRAYRAFRWGRLAEIFMIDVRQYRDPEVPANTNIGGIIDGQDTDLPGGRDMFLPGRTTLGAARRAWLQGRLSRCRAAWKFIGCPYNVNPLKIVDYETQPGDTDPPNNEGVYVSNEAWDDYQVERREILSLMDRRSIRNVVFTSGHTHVYFASELQPDFDDPTSPVVAFDFVTGSLTADPDPSEIAPLDVLRVAEQLLLAANAPYLKYVNLINQGYAVVDATPEETIVDFRAIDTYDLGAQPFTVARFRVIRDSRVLHKLL